MNTTFTRLALIACAIVGQLIIRHFFVESIFVNSITHADEQVRPLKEHDRMVASFWWPIFFLIVLSTATHIMHKYVLIALPS